MEWWLQHAVVALVFPVSSSGGSVYLVKPLNLGLAEPWDGFVAPKHPFICDSKKTAFPSVQMGHFCHKTKKYNAPLDYLFNDSYEISDDVTRKEYPSPYFPIIF